MFAGRFEPGAKPNGYRMGHDMSSIADSFGKIVSRTQLTTADIEAFNTHEEQVVARLKADFGVVKTVRMGSFSRGSAVRGSSDLDLLVVLTRGEITWGDRLKKSGTVMQNVRASLAARFRQTEIGRDGQAVVVSFADGRIVDVVPAAYDGPQSNGWPLYSIPDGAESWLATAPDTHGKYIADGENASGNKLKSVTRILKYWAACRSPRLPLSGFHLELLLTQTGICAPGRSLAACVADALSLLARRECRALQDPCGVSGLIRAAATDAKRGRLLAAVAQSAGWATTAVNYENGYDTASARRYWSMTFNGGFPA